VGGRGRQKGGQTAAKRTVIYFSSLISNYGGENGNVIHWRGGNKDAAIRASLYLLVTGGGKGGEDDLADGYQARCRGKLMLGRGVTFLGVKRGKGIRKKAQRSWHVAKSLSIGFQTCG